MLRNIKTKTKSSSKQHKNEPTKHKKQLKKSAKKQTHNSYSLQRRAMSTAAAKTPLQKVEEFRKSRPYAAEKLVTFSGDDSANLTDITKPFKYKATAMTYHVISPQHDAEGYVATEIATQQAQKSQTDDKQKKKKDDDKLSPTTIVHFITKKQFDSGVDFLQNKINNNVEWNSLLPAIHAQGFNGKESKMATIIDKSSNPVLLVGLGDVIDGLTTDEDAEHFNISTYRQLVHDTGAFIKEKIPTTKNIHVQLPDIYFTSKKKHDYGCGNGVKDTDPYDDDEEEEDKSDENKKPLSNTPPARAEDVVSLNEVISLTLQHLTTVNHVYDKFFTPSTAKEKNPTHFENLFITTPSNEQHITLPSYVQSRNTINIAESIIFAREVGNETSNIAKPQFMQDLCETFYNTHQNKKNPNTSKQILSLKVYQRDELKSQGYNLIRSVGQGSNPDDAERVIVFEYDNSVVESDGIPFTAANKKKKIKPTTDEIFGLCGKGITFDTGGLNLKGAHALGMKYDKLGAVNLFAVLRSMVLNNVEFAGPNYQKVITALGFAENDIGPNAIHPGALITERNGTTTEIIDADAEGRDLLASVIDLVQNNYNANNIITQATLTGSVCATLGPSAAGIFANNKKQINDIINIGQQNNENYWHLPIFPLNYEKTKGSQSDYRNCTVESGIDASNAAAFMDRFIRKNTNFVHLDIASVADASSAEGVLPEGATGWGINTVYKFITKEKF